MFDSAEAARMYDLLYEDRKSYPDEAARVTDLVRARRPGATSLLDVGCGTGAHLAAFARHFTDVAGLDAAAPMIERAAERLPDAALHVADMRDFDLGRRFDAVVSMFSAIGYLATVADLEQAAAAMSRHLADDGVLVVEPWFFPERFTPGHIAAHSLKYGDHGIARVARSTLEGGRTTRIDIHYLLGDPDTGVRHSTDIDRLTLFTHDEYRDAFGKAGLDVEHLDTKGTPGLFIGIHRRHKK
jgi:SAM-dependent methyltransferase